MHIRILSITHKTPAWIRAGYEDYAKRLRKPIQLSLVEIRTKKAERMDSDWQRSLVNEGKKMLAAIKPQHHIIALDVQGVALSTEELAQKMQGWLSMGKNIDLLIGGPEGLAPECLNIAHERWSLSPLTFPHFLVKIILAEQLYRAQTILQKHPYHR